MNSIDTAAGEISDIRCEMDHAMDSEDIHTRDQLFDLVVEWSQKLYKIEQTLK